MDRDEVWTAIDAQRLRLTGLLEQLTDAQWRHPSLCEGWTVRDVAGHLTFAQSTVLEMVGEVFRTGALGGMKRMIRDGAIRRAARPTEQLIADIRGMIGSQRHIQVVTYRETLIDMDWSVGDGREVSGPIEAILLLLTGRTVALTRVAGAGAAALTERLAPTRR